MKSLDNHSWDSLSPEEQSIKSDINSDVKKVDLFSKNDLKTIDKDRRSIDEVDLIDLRQDFIKSWIAASKPIIRVFDKFEFNKGLFEIQEKIAINNKIKSLCKSLLDLAWKPHEDLPLSQMVAIIRPIMDWEEDVTTFDFLLSNWTVNSLNENFLEYTQSDLEVKDLIWIELSQNPILVDFLELRQPYPDYKSYTTRNKNTTMSEVAFYEHSLRLHSFVNDSSSQKKSVKKIYVNEYNGTEDSFTRLRKNLEENIWNIESEDAKVSEHYFLVTNQNGGPRLSPYKDVKLLQKSGKLSLKMWDFHQPSSKKLKWGKWELIESEGKMYFCTFDGKKLVRYRTYNIWPNYETFIKSFDDPNNSEHFSMLKQTKNFEWKLGDVLHTAQEIAGLFVDVASSVYQVPTNILIWWNISRNKDGIWRVKWRVKWRGKDIDDWWSMDNNPVSDLLWWDTESSESWLSQNESIEWNPLQEAFQGLDANQKWIFKQIINDFMSTNEWEFDQAFFDRLWTFADDQSFDNQDQDIASVFWLLSELISKWENEAVLAVFWG